MITFDEAFIKLKKIQNKSVRDLINPTNSSFRIREAKINKGGLGQMIEAFLGLPPSRTTKDFQDGELKTNKCDRNGKPSEPLAIIMIKSIIDELISDKPQNFFDSNLFKKIENFMVMGVCKESSDIKDWSFKYLFKFSYKKNKPLYKEFEKDYYTICSKIRNDIKNSSDGFIHTSNGEFIQIRSKDSKDSKGNYHPIYSKLLGKYISNKNHAFYFHRKGIKKLIRIWEDSQQD